MPPAVRRLVSIAALVLGALALAAPAFADNAGLTPVEPESPNAEAITQTYYLLLIVTGLVFVAAEGALLVFVVRYRRRRRAVDAEGPQIHGNTRLEVLWTVIPVFLVAIIVAFVFYKLPDVSDVSRAANEPANEPNLKIDVRGHQFYWEYGYPDGSVLYDTMVVPVGRTVELDVTSQVADVIHSWWIPALGGKIDAIPGKLNHTWFRAEREGVYEGNCAEYCGLNHAKMEMNVRAVPAGRYDAELARLSSSGRAQFVAACSKCHNITGPQLVGPTLQGNPTLADAEALALLVRNGRNEMPAVGAGWSDEQIENLVNYTRTIAGGGQ
jgi:cytochrome c oxidase subunit II